MDLGYVCNKGLKDRGSVCVCVCVHSFIVFRMLEKEKDRETERKRVCVHSTSMRPKYYVSNYINM